MPILQIAPSAYSAHTSCDKLLHYFRLHANGFNNVSPPTHSSHPRIGETISHDGKCYKNWLHFLLFFFFIDTYWEKKRLFLPIALSINFRINWFHVVILCVVLLRLMGSVLHWLTALRKVWIILIRNAWWQTDSRESGLLLFDQFCCIS